MSKLPLEGIRVADFSWVWAGPYLTSILGMMGADVIKFETRKRPDVVRMLYPWTYADAATNDTFLEWYNGAMLEGKPFNGPMPTYDQGGFFGRLGMCKKSISLDLSNPKGADVARRVVAKCDILIENYAPRVMTNFGLGYEACREVRPDIIYVSLSGAGATGPLRDYVLYGAPQVAFSGLASLTGYTDGPPMPLPVSYGDPLAALHGGFAILSCLHHRRETGEGQYIDFSQWESTINLLPEGIMDCIMNGRVMPRMGNRDWSMAPHDVFPCKGDDKWISIAVGSEEEWQALCEVMGNPEWTRKPDFADIYSRWQNQDELNVHLGEWTASFEAYELMMKLQAAGVAATPSYDNSEVVNDPHLKERGFFLELDHPVMGRRAQPGTPLHFSETPPQFFRAPLMGEHNMEVLGGLVGMTNGEIEQLITEKVIF